LYVATRIKGRYDLIILCDSLLKVLARTSVYNEFIYDMVIIALWYLIYNFYSNKILLCYCFIIFEISLLVINLFMTDLCNDWKNKYIHIEDISYLNKNIFVNFYVCYISICTNFVKKSNSYEYNGKSLLEIDVSII